MGGRWLDTDLAIRTEIPDDVLKTGIQGVQTAFYDPFRAIIRDTNVPLDNNAALIRILRNTDAELSLKTIGNAFFPRLITVGTSPTELISPNRTPRGYKIVNPNTTVSGVATAVTVFPAGTVFAVGTTNSAAINVSAHGGAAFILNITEATAGPMTVNLQTQDPISGNWATAQADIFSGAIALGTYYANVGIIGIDQQARLSISTAGDTFTGSIAAILKPALAGTIAGPTVFMGGQDVTIVLGYPLLSGNIETILLRENTPLWAVAAADTNIFVFEMQ
jgi:hypothetical protein